jgi:endoglucanase
MSNVSRLIALVAATVAVALIPASASADLLIDPDGFHLDAPVYTVSQDAGSASITIERTDTSRQAQIRYETLPGTAVRGQDYTPVKAMIDFMPGQASATFSIPIVDHHLLIVPRTIRIALFGPHSQGVSVPSTAVLTILSGNVATVARDPLNPLALPTAPPVGNPLSGATPFIDYQYGLANMWQRRLAGSHPAEAAALGLIAREPEVHRWGNWSGPDPGIQVSQYMVRTQAEEPGTVPEFATYWIVDPPRIHPHCGHYVDPAWRVRAYHNWVESLAAGVGDAHAIMFEEMDSLITVGCLSKHGLAVRLAMLRDANQILSQVPHLVVYEDAGAADGPQSAPYMASLLRRAGVSLIQGFFLNSTHFDWTLHEIQYGDAISRLIGGKHFVVNTAENGRGPLHPKDRVHHGNEVICDPAGRGLGPVPTFNTGYPNVDAFAWIANPGKSGGSCGRGMAKIGFFDPRLALELIKNRNFSAGAGNKLAG